MRVGGETRGEGFTTGFEPLVEHQRLEQRSREAFEKESRIGFARPEPFAQERKLVPASVLPDGRTRERRGGLLPSSVADRRASRNLLLHKGRRRDVLKIQRTALGHQTRKKRAGRTKEKELHLCRGKSGKGAGVFRPFHRSKVLKSEVPDGPGGETDQQNKDHHRSELHH